jgi:HSP20 family protein
MIQRVSESGLGAWPGVYPQVNLSEDDDNLYVKAEVPGVESGDIELSVEEDSLILRGERKIVLPEKVNLHRRERTGGVFRRKINLPARIATTKVTAEVKNGVLRVTLPKAPEAKPRAIKVKAE